MNVADVEYYINKDENVRVRGGKRQRKEVREKDVTVYKRILCKKNNESSMTHKASLIKHYLVEHHAKVNDLQRYCVFKKSGVREDCVFSSFPL